MLFAVVQCLHFPSSTMYGRSDGGRMKIGAIILCAVYRTSSIAARSDVFDELRGAWLVVCNWFASTGQRWIYFLRSN